MPENADSAIPELFPVVPRDLWWREAWRRGFAPQISVCGLEALKRALESDDSRLVQGATTVPAPLMCVQDWPVEAACALSYCGWMGEGLETVGEVEEFFSSLCFEADQTLGEAAACRWFLNAFDDWPRSEMIKNLLPEVQRELDRRNDANTTVA